jgi:hypothetical protein
VAKSTPPSPIFFLAPAVLLAYTLTLDPPALFHPSTATITCSSAQSFSGS